MANFKLTFYYLLGSIALFQLLNACVAKSKEKLVEGEWNALWSSSNSYEGFGEKELQMPGKFVFKGDGTVEIIGYGFDGCLFSNDTITSKVNYKFTNTSLMLIEGKNENGLEYEINNWADQQIELSLLNDIKVELWR